MYGYSFASKFTGSLYGKGVINYAVWDYVISTMRPHAGQGALVELNAREIANVFGDVTPKQIEDAIAFHCSPDGDSRSPDEGGARLVKTGPFLYRVVNYEKYRRLKNEYDRREANRLAVQQCRERKEAAAAGLPPPSTPKRPGRKPRASERLAAAEVLRESKKLKVPLVPGEKPYLQGVRDGVLDPDTGRPIP
jgi:hypothetical protein